MMQKRRVFESGEREDEMHEWSEWSFGMHAFSVPTRTPYLGAGDRMWRRMRARRDHEGEDVACGGRDKD